MNIVSTIKRLCNERHTTLNRVEIELGLSKSSISKWDTNMPSVDKISKVADYFGVTTDYLLGRTDDPKGAVFPQILRITTKDGKALTEEEMQKVIDFAEMVVKARDK
nr:MAG TPA: repressor protein [Caudoviricetes sp.]